MFYSRLLVSALLILLSLATWPGRPARAQGGDDPVSAAVKALDAALFPKRRPRLVSTIEHNETFPPLPKTLRPGSILDRKNITPPTAQSENSWYQIPSWLAGEYSYGELHLAGSKDFTNGKEKFAYMKKLPPAAHGRPRGLFRDTRGRIWQKAYGGKIRLNKLQKDIDVARFEDEIVGFTISRDQYVESSRGIDFYVDENQKILEVLRYERLRRFTHEKDGSVSVFVTTKHFNADGFPLNQADSEGKMIKREPFAALQPGESTRAGGTYEQCVKSFKKYLELVGKPELFPPSLEKVIEPGDSGSSAKSDSESGTEHTQRSGNKWHSAPPGSSGREAGR